MQPDTDVKPMRDAAFMNIMRWAVWNSKMEVSKVGRHDEIEVQPAPWIFSGQAGIE